MNRKKLEELLRVFRANIKQNKTKIVRETMSHGLGKFCVFCVSEKDLTKEHVLPQWLFSKSKSTFYISTFNKSKIKYQRTTVPACQNCNTNILGELEKYILTNLKFPYDPKDLDIIILWLEILSYKFHINDYSMRYIKDFSTNKRIPYLQNFSIAELGHDNPAQELRKSINRLSLKRKTKKINSFVFFKSKNKNKHFFHSINNFIFVESPRLKCAVLHFLEDEFEDEHDAHKEAMSIIEKNY